MSIQIEGVGKQKISYRNPQEIIFDSLADYTLLAKKSISKFANSFYKGLSTKMLKDEDAISSIANAIMMADWRFKDNYTNKDGNKKTKYSYRNQCALWAIQSYVTKNYKNKSKNYKIYSLDYNSDSEETTAHSYITDNRGRSPEQILIDKENKQQTIDKVNEIMSLPFLSEKQKQYFNLYYIENYTFEQIGKEFNLTREAIRQSIKKTITKVKEYYDTIYT